MRRLHDLRGNATLVAVIAAAFAMGLTGCTRAAPAATPSRASPTPPTSAAPTTVAPLTGLPLSDPAVAQRPAVTVKIDNAPQARPQAGLDRADIVIEERVEGGVTRFMAIFQSQDPGQAGPVRSVRSTDPPIVRPIGGLFAYSGGIGPFVALLHADGGVTDVGFDADPSSYVRRDDRLAPHNLYTTVSALRADAPGVTTPPPALFDYLGAGESFGNGSATPAVDLFVQMGPPSAGEWRWDAPSRSWLRFTDSKAHFSEDGTQLRATTVIVQFVPYSRTSYVDIAGNEVDQADVVGTGDAWVLADGQIVRGHWSKASDAGVTTYTDDSGTPIRIPPGPTWIMLAPIGASTSVSIAAPQPLH